MASALSPDGRFLALALRNENRVVLLSLAGEETRVVSTVVLNDGARASDPFDIAFGVQGHTLWVLSGALPGQEELGPQPTRIAAFAVKTIGDEATLSVASTLDLVAGPPRALGVSRSQPLPSGAAIRRPPAVVQVLVAAAGQGVNAPQSSLLSLGSQGPAPLATMEGRVTDLLIEPLGHFAFACVIHSAGTAKLAWLRADSRDAQTETTTLWPAAANVTSCAIDVQP